MSMRLSPAKPANGKAAPVRVLRMLGLHGLDHLDAAILAALASESPLLLIGPHGSARSRRC